MENTPIPANNDILFLFLLSGFLHEVVILLFIDTFRAIVLIENILYLYIVVLSLEKGFKER